MGSDAQVVHRRERLADERGRPVVVAQGLEVLRNGGVHAHQHGEYPQVTSLAEEVQPQRRGEVRRCDGQFTTCCAHSIYEPLRGSPLDGSIMEDYSKLVASMVTSFPPANVLSFRQGKFR